MTILDIFRRSGYSLLEESVALLVKDIVELGHEVGLLVPDAIARTAPDEQRLHRIAQDCALLNERARALVNYVSEEGGARRDNCRRQDRLARPLR